MLTVAYCRVSTDEQAAEGYSIDGQTAKLQGYASLHDLGEVTVIADPGASGKNLKRTGVQRLLEMVRANHVGHVLLWRLDRLSRDLGDLIELSELFAQHDVVLHSVTENLDMSSPTGRMFFHILGSFAQFYREPLAENVKMGMAQARAQGRWTNRPPTGYDLDDGLLVPNADAATIVRIFEMRASGATQPEIEDATGVKHSTVVAILRNQAYIGQMRHKDEWLPGAHEPLITQELWDAAHRGRTPGVRRGRDLMSGRVRCGGCGRAMSIEHNGQGQRHYRCKHRGKGCKLPARSNKGLLRAAVLGLRLLDDEGLQEAIRQHLAQRRAAGTDRRRRTPGSAEALAELRNEQDKLLQAYYKDLIDEELFAREQARIRHEIENHQHDANEVGKQAIRDLELATKFEEILKILEELNIGDLWPYATETQRRQLLDELLDHIEVGPEHLTVHIHGVPSLNVAFNEVGLKDSQTSRVGGGT